MEKNLCTLTFEGDAVDGKINIKSLASTMLSFGEAITKIYEIESNGKNIPKVYIKATRANCFSVDLEIQQAIKDILSFSAGTGVALTVSWVIKKIITQIKIKKFAQNQIPKVIIKGNNNSVVLVVGHQEMEIEKDDEIIRKQKILDKPLNELTSVLDEGQIDTLKIKGPNEGIEESISYEEKPFFNLKEIVNKTKIRIQGKIEKMTKGTGFIGFYYGTTYLPCYPINDSIKEKCIAQFDSQLVELYGEVEIDENGVLKKMMVEDIREISTEIPLNDEQE